MFRLGKGWGGRLKGDGGRWGGDGKDNPRERRGIQYRHQYK